MSMMQHFQQPGGSAAAPGSG